MQPASDASPSDNNSNNELTAREIIAEQEAPGQDFVPFQLIVGHVEPPGKVSSGRHRKLSETPTDVVLRAAAGFLVIGVATAAGIASFHGPTQRSSMTEAAPVPTTPAAPIVADSARKIANPIGPRGTAYLDALKRENIPIADIPTLLLVADSVCARQGDTAPPAQTDRLMAAFPGRWNHQQAAVIVDSAIKLVCTDSALHGANVSAGVYPEK